MEWEVVVVVVLTRRWTTFLKEKAQHDSSGRRRLMLFVDLSLRRTKRYTSFTSKIVSIPFLHKMSYWSK